MKVLHVIPSVAPRYGGPSYAIVGMGRALVRAGVDILVATTDADGPGRLPFEHGMVTEYQNVPMIFFPRQLSESFKYSRPFGQWLSAHVQDYDVVHLHAVFSYSSIVGASACRHVRVPYVVRPLGSLDPWSLKQKSLAKQVLWHLGVKQLLAGAVAIHYTTDEERRLAERVTGNAPGVVIPLGMVLEAAETAVAANLFRGQHSTLKDHPYILSLGRLHPKKGLEILIDAFAMVTHAGRLADWRLIIAGDGEATYVPGLRAHARASGAGGRIIFAGWLEGEAKSAALNGASLFALTSHQENFGLSVAEAMTFGVPVLVSSSVNLASDIEAFGAGWVVSLDGQAVRDALAIALADQEERERRGAAARVLATTRFGEQRVTDQLCSLYTAIQDDLSVDQSTSLDTKPSAS